MRLPLTFTPLVDFRSTIHQRSLARFEPRVFPRDRRMIQHQIVPLGAPDREIRLEIGDARHAEIDVVDLELVHANGEIIAAATLTLPRR